MSAADRVLSLARESGFDLAAIAPLAAPAAAGRFETWLDAGRHAGMAWLERDRARIVDPRRVLPEGKSILVVGLAHTRPAVGLEGGGRVARYAAGRDYHNWMVRRLRGLARRLVREGLASRWRTIVDAGPLLERSHAARAGLGFESKAANLLNPELGPWFFLGELLLDVELDAGPALPSPVSCGTCTACLDACPTAAIVEPGVVDARLCISYHTIENRGAVPRALRARFGEWVFGCDVCSEVCPFGRKAPDRSARLGTHDAIAGGSLIDWLLQPERVFAERFRGSPLQRPRATGLARNAAIALGNNPSEAGRDALLQAVESHPAPLVREAAGWALTHGHHGEASRRAVEQAAAREPDPEQRAALLANLET